MEMNRAKLVEDVNNIDISKDSKNPYFHISNEKINPAKSGEESDNIDILKDSQNPNFQISIVEKNPVKSGEELDNIDISKYSQTISNSNNLLSKDLGANPTKNVLSKSQILGSSSTISNLPEIVPFRSSGVMHFTREESMIQFATMAMKNENGIIAIDQLFAPLVDTLLEFLRSKTSFKRIDDEWKQVLHRKYVDHEKLSPIPTLKPDHRSSNSKDIFSEFSSLHSNSLSSGILCKLDAYWYWDLKWRRNLFVWEENVLSELLILLDGVHPIESSIDKIWCHDVGKIET
ncbi:hypothetical protein ACFE04_011206 [Oxalis oulophora]